MSAMESTLSSTGDVAATARPSSLVVFAADAHAAPSCKLLVLLILLSLFVCLFLSTCCIYDRFNGSRIHNFTNQCLSAIAPYLAPSIHMYTLTTVRNGVVRQ